MLDLTKSWLEGLEESVATEDIEDLELIDPAVKEALDDRVLQIKDELAGAVAFKTVSK